MNPVTPRRWWLPAVSGDYLVARAGDTPTLKGWSPLPPLFARATIEQALTSGGPRASIVFDLYQAIGGPTRPGLGRPAFSDYRREIARHLAEAFRAGTLVAYRRNPPLIAHIKEEPPPPPPPPEDPKEEPESYVNIRLVGEDGSAIPGERYRIVLPDGTSREGRLDGTGSATVRGRFSGNCKVTFPDLDSAAWESA